MNVGAVVKTYGGDITAVRSANAKRLQYLQLDRAYQRAVLELNKAMGVRSRKPRNIVDYTGTIMELFGKFYTVTDVSKVMAKEYKIKVPEEELKKFKPCLDVDEVEDAIYSRDLTDVIDILKEMMKNDKPEQENETEAEKEE